MARGRSLAWLTIVLLAAGTASWSLARFGQGPSVLSSAWMDLLAVAALAASALLVFLVLGRVLRRGERSAARSLAHLETLATAIVAVVAVGAVLGGFRAALVGLGLIGFGLTLALQRPILAVAGWAALVFGGSVRVGDRIRVGDLRGDVLDITLFATRLWQIGMPDSNTPGRPTGHIVTVSNAVFLEEPVANATSDNPVIFDEFVVNVPFEADLDLAQKILADTSDQVLDAGAHARAAARYRRLTKGLTMEANFPERPVILAESKPSWMEFRLRYLVDARRASAVQSDLTTTWSTACEPHADAIPQVYPRNQPQAIDASGRPAP